MNHQLFRSILERLNATSDDIIDSILMTKDGVALLRMPSFKNNGVAEFDEDKISALSSSVLCLGQQLMKNFSGHDLHQILIKGKETHILAIRNQEMALTIHAKSNANMDFILSEMEKSMELVCMNI